MTVLSIEGLSKSFGDFMAVDNVSLGLKQGEMRGLIGSNGAGKSTLLHLIYGRLQADHGTVHFGEADVTRQPAFQRARLGMGLVFQITSVFNELTVEENLRLGAMRKSRKARSSKQSDIERVLALVELTGSRYRQTGHLSHGERRWLEIGVVLLTQPSLLLLDEPTSGMTRAESRRTADRLRQLQVQQAADAMLIVEHNIEFIKLVSDRVTVMHRGHVIADGTIEEVQANPDVQASYLGRLR